MSITFPAAYSAQLKNSVIDVDWLFHLKNNNAGYVYLSSKDRTVGSTRYYGVVEDSGEISGDLDLINCTASIGEISISCADDYRNGKLSAELLHNGSDVYINQQVLIYECINDEATLANCPKLYEGRLKEVDIQGNSIVLVIEQWTPFDHIMIPNVKSTLNGVYAPIFYGPGNNNTASTIQSSRQMFPCPFHWDGSLVGGIPVQRGRRYFASGFSHAVAATPHYYDPKIDSYVVIESPTATSVVNGIDSTYIDFYLKRNFSFRPDDYDDSRYDNTNAWTTNPTFGYNGNTGNFAASGTMSVTVLEHEETRDYVLIVPQIEGIWSHLNVYVYNVLTLEAKATTGETQLQVSVDGGSTFNTIETRTTVGATSAGWDNTGDIVGDLVDSKLPKTLIIRLFGDAHGAGTTDCNCAVGDVYIDGTVTLDRAVENSEDTFRNTDMVYLGTSGQLGSYTDASGAAVLEVQEIHRDMMKVYGGVDFDNDYMENWIAAGPGAYDLDAARDNWDCRLWLLEPVPLKEVIEKLQFEGCFIFMLVADSDGSGTTGGRYVWVQDTYSNANFPLIGNDTLQVFDESDYTDLSIGHTDVYEIITRTKYNYFKEPRNDVYTKTEDFNNTTDRDVWNLSTSHFEQIDLDYLFRSRNGTGDIYDSGSGDDTPNESICLYRDNIQSEPKIMIDCEIINKSKTNIERGDIIQFNDTNVLPYGKAWANLWFMVIREARSKQGVSITAREVYRT